MSGLVVCLALFAALQISSATYCSYTEFIDEHLADKANLYCFDGGQIEINQNSKLCSDGLSTRREDNMSVLCKDGYTLVGYKVYPCDTDTGVLATKLSADETLKHYSACVALAEDSVAVSVCTGVDVAAADSKLLVDQLFSAAVESVDLVEVDATDIVYYPLACAAGFGFPASVEGTVYGYCSNASNSAGNYVLSIKDATADQQCQELCAANPTTTTEQIPNFASASIADSQLSGSSISAEVTCETGFALDNDAKDAYTFSCTGKSSTVDGAESEGGAYSCGEDCPRCLAGCPMSPTVAQISNSADVPNLDSVAITERGAPGQTVSVGVTCGDGFRLGKDAPPVYDITCSSDSDNTAADSGVWTFGNVLPECKPLCGTDNIATIAHVDRVIMSEEGGHGEVKQGTVVCDDGYDFEFDKSASDTYGFTCIDGEFSCTIHCPVCYPECSVPAENDKFTYNYDDDELDAATKLKHGQEVEVKCKNDSLNVIGPKFMVCKESLTGTESLEYDENEEAPHCADSDICESPTVKDGTVNTRNNIQVGGIYTITCKSRHWFDTDTTVAYGDINNPNIYRELSVECLEGERVADFVCYFGCLAPDIAGGILSPDISVTGEAPYSIGAKITFNCLDGVEIPEGQAVATCDEDGNIPSLICGACSFTLSLFLAASLLLSIL